MNANRTIAGLSGALLLAGALGLPVEAAAHEGPRHEYRKELRHHAGHRQPKHRGHHRRHGHGHGHRHDYDYGPVRAVTPYVIPRAAVRDHGRQDRIGVDITYRGSW